MPGWHCLTGDLPGGSGGGSDVEASPRRGSGGRGGRGWAVHGAASCNLHCRVVVLSRTLLPSNLLSTRTHVDVESNTLVSVGFQALACSET